MQQDDEIAFPTCNYSFLLRGSTTIWHHARYRQKFGLLPGFSLELLKILWPSKNGIASISKCTFVLECDNTNAHDQSVISQNQSALLRAFAYLHSRIVNTGTEIIIISIHIAGEWSFLLGDFEA